MGKSKMMTRMLDRKARQEKRLRGGCNQLHNTRDSRRWIPGVTKIDTIPVFADRASDPNGVPYDPELAFQCMMFLEGIGRDVSIDVDFEIPDPESKEFDRILSQCYKSAACGISMIGSSGLRVRIPKKSTAVIDEVMQVALSLRVLERFVPSTAERFMCDDRMSSYLTLYVPTIQDCEAVKGVHERIVPVAEIMCDDDLFYDIRKLVMNENSRLIDAVFDLCDLVARTGEAIGFSVEPFETTDLEYCVHPMSVFSWAIQAWHDYVYPLSVKIVNRHIELNVA